MRPWHQICWTVLAATLAFVGAVAYLFFEPSSRSWLLWGYMLAAVSIVADRRLEGPP